MNVSSWTWVKLRLWMFRSVFLYATVNHFWCVKVMWKSIKVDSCDCFHNTASSTYKGQIPSWMCLLMNISSTELGPRRRNLGLNIMKGSRNINNTYHSNAMLCCMWRYQCKNMSTGRCLLMNDIYCANNLFLILSPWFCHDFSLSTDTKQCFFYTIMVAYPMKTYIPNKQLCKMFTAQIWYRNIEEGIIEFRF